MANLEEISNPSEISSVTSGMHSAAAKEVLEENKNDLNDTVPMDLI